MKIKEEIELFKIKPILFASFIVLITVILFLFLDNSNLNYLINRKENVLRIEVIYNLDSRTSNTLEIDNNDNLIKIYNMIKMTKKEQIFKRPTEYEANTGEVLADIIICYNNGNKDKLHLSKENKYLFKYINSYGSGGQGWFGGLNEELYNYIDNLIKEQHAKGDDNRTGDRYLS